jgi:hypothetical protein
VNADVKSTIPIEIGTSFVEIAKIVGELRGENEQLKERVRFLESLLQSSQRRIDPFVIPTVTS